jgi:large subunit ribosomal protein L6
MGRIGKRLLAIPNGVEVKIGDSTISVKGPKGSLKQAYLPTIKLKVEDGKVATLCESEDRKVKALQGLYNSLIKNMLEGVTNGFQKDLEMVGVGYRATLQGKKLQLALGYSHPILIDPPDGIVFEVEGTNKIKVKGSDRWLVGEIAARIRRFREVEPYKGKGIKYLGEVVRRKAGKAAKAVGGTGG